MRVTYTRHGMSRRPEYQIWAGIKDRCLNPKATSYPRYGARGITICERWRLSFTDFLADVGDRPGRKFSLDRYPNQSGNYEPGNVRWATAKMQMNNVCRNRFLEIRGQRKTVSEWADLSGIPVSHIYNRLRNGWSEEKAVFEPVRHTFKNFCRVFSREQQETRHERGELTHMEKSYLLFGWQI